MKKKIERFVMAEKKMVGFATVMIDRETGVNYAWFPNSGVCPLYNPDGSLIVTDIPEEK